MTFCTETRLRLLTLDDDACAYDYRDGKPFAAYCDVVRSVLTPEPVPIRAINLRLGSRAIPHWTLDALDRVAEYHPAFIDKYSLKGDPRK